MALRRRAVPRWLRRLGTVSYSVYLVQALVLLAVPALGSPLLAAVLWGAVVVGASEVTYRVVERPAVRLGRRLAGERGATREQPLLVHPVRSVEWGTARRAAGAQRIAV